MSFQHTTKKEFYSVLIRYRRTLKQLIKERLNAKRSLINFFLCSNATEIFQQSDFSKEIPKSAYLIVPNVDFIMDSDKNFKAFR